MFSPHNIYKYRICLTRVNLQVHLANQDENPADSLQHTIRNPVHNGVTVAWYVVLAGWKRQVTH